MKKNPFSKIKLTNIFIFFANIFEQKPLQSYYHNFGPFLLKTGCIL